MGWVMAMGVMVGRRCQRGNIVELVGGRGRGGAWDLRRNGQRDRGANLILRVDRQRDGRIDL